MVATLLLAIGAGYATRVEKTPDGPALPNVQQSRHISQGAAVWEFQLNDLTPCVLVESGKGVAVSCGWGRERG